MRTRRSGAGGGRIASWPSALHLHLVAVPRGRRGALSLRRSVNSDHTVSPGCFPPPDGRGARAPPPGGAVRPDHGSRVSVFAFENSREARGGGTLDASHAAQVLGQEGV